MRVRVTLVLLAVLSVSVSAQLPRELGDLVRKAPSLDSFMRGRPLDVTFDDTLGQVPLLDRRQQTRTPGDLKRLPRTSTGTFMLQPGLWEGTFESFCLKPATWAPGGGDGYLFAPIKGSRSSAISSILRNLGLHPSIPRPEVQMLLWGILARTRIDQMPPRLQTVARALLPAGEINAINVSGLQILDVAERTRLLGGLTAPVRQALEIESDLRYQLSRPEVTYAEVERIAILNGARPPAKPDGIKRGQWSVHPNGYFVRYFPDSYSNMRLQVLVPSQVKVVRDQLNRIVSIEDATGRIETTYNDAVPPRVHPTNPRLRAYRFRTLRITRPGPGGQPRVLDLKDTGYTFLQSRPRRGFVAQAVAVVSGGGRWLLTLVGGTPLEARQDWEGWAERGEQAQGLYEDYEYLRDRSDGLTKPPDDSAMDDIADTEHYEDGVEAALTGDLSDRLEWITDIRDRFNRALEAARARLDTLPDRSDPGYDPGGGVGVPSSLSDQIVGSSGR